MKYATLSAGMAATLRRRSAPYFRADCFLCTSHLATSWLRNRGSNAIEKPYRPRSLPFPPTASFIDAGEFDSGPKLPVTRYATVSREPTNFPLFLHRSSTIRFQDSSSGSIRNNEPFLRSISLCLCYHMCEN